MRRHRGLLKTSVWALLEEGAGRREGDRLGGKAAGHGKLWRRREDRWGRKGDGWEGRECDRGVQGL